MSPIKYITRVGLAAIVTASLYSCASPKQTVKPIVDNSYQNHPSIIKVDPSVQEAFERNKRDMLEYCKKKSYLNDSKIPKEEKDSYESACKRVENIENNCHDTSMYYNEGCKK